jgi:hypothetical protein
LLRGISLAGEGDVMLATAGSVTCPGSVVVTGPKSTAAAVGDFASGSVLGALAGAPGGGSLPRPRPMGGSAGGTERGPGRVLTGGGNTLFGWARGGAGFFVLLDLSRFIKRKGAGSSAASQHSRIASDARVASGGRPDPANGGWALWPARWVCNEAA